MANDAGAVQTVSLGLGAPGRRLPLTLTVGFAGHRVVADDAQAGEALKAAFAIVSAAFETLADAPLYGGDSRLGEAYEGPPQLRLLTGDAPGADRLAIEQWRTAALGPIHRLYPYRDGATGAPLTDRPSRAKLEDRVPAPGPEIIWTGIDAVGLGMEAGGHAELGRWLVRHADVLVALWDGKPARGPGGTGDTLLRVFERGAPILWIKPGETQVRLIRPRFLGLSGDAGAVMARAVQETERATAAALSAILAEAFAPPGEILTEGRDPEISARLDYARIDPSRPHGWLTPLAWLFDLTLWRTFAFFRALGGRGGRAPARAASSLPSAVAGQPGFAYITEARRNAGGRAQRLSNIHRSEQLLLILVVLAAVAVGVSPALAHGAAEAEAAHIAAAWVELSLGAFAFVFAWLARRAHRHRRWSDARRLAERLRAAAAAWLFGVDISDAPVAPPQTWTEWRALAVLRAAGPRTGWLDRAELDAMIAWVSAELIGGQVRYHAGEGRAAGRLDRWVRGLAEAAFFFLMFSLAAYLWATTFHWPNLPPGAGGWLLMISAVSPAVGAASLALEATNGFSEAAERSVRFGRDFEKLGAMLAAADQPPLHDAQEVVRRAGQLLMEDADSWRDRLDRRRLVRSG
jgi:hypothetical protein